MLAARLLYHLQNTMATSSNTANPATPPTIPPARTEAGGVLSSPPLLAAEVDVADCDTDAV
jgi:hypothetical protein